MDVPVHHEACAYNADVSGGGIHDAHIDLDDGLHCECLCERLSSTYGGPLRFVEERYLADDL